MPSTGLTTTEASIWWGSSQAVLSAAVAAHVRNILIYPSNYNVPLHILRHRTIGLSFALPPVLMHYHHLSAAPYHRQLAAGLHLTGTVPEARDWVLSQCAALDWDLAG